MNDESNLPKWAQHTLAALRSELRQVEKENQILRKEHPKSKVALLTLGGKGEYDELWLPERGPVRFFLDGSETFKEDFSVDCFLRNGALELMGHSSIVIYPGSSNTVRVEPAR